MIVEFESRVTNQTVNSNRSAEEEVLAGTSAGFTGTPKNTVHRSERLNRCQTIADGFPGCNISEVLQNKNVPKHTIQSKFLDRLGICSWFPFISLLLRNQLAESHRLLYGSLLQLRYRLAGQKGCFEKSPRRRIQFVSQPARLFIVYLLGFIFPNTA